jgi:endonuclease III
MSIRCPKCKKEYDSTLFEFGSEIICECGNKLGLKHEEILIQSEEIYGQLELNLSPDLKVNVKNMMPKAKIRKKNIHPGELGIDLESGNENELFKWFLACLLFGRPIQQVVAKRTYFEFVKEGVLTPREILKAGWDKLVEILDQGHYVRYDFSTATKLLEISEELKQRYGSLGELLRQSKNRRDLETKLQEFKGIGPITARIFLKELKNWPVSSHQF